MHALLAAIVMLLCTASGLAGPIGDSARSVGLTPEGLAASGLGVAEVDELLARVSDAESLRQQIAQAKSARDSASEAVAACRTNIAENPPTEELYLLLQQAVAHLEECQTAVKAAESALRTHAIATLPSATRERVLAYVDARTYDVPDDFKVVVREVDIWRRLEAAILAERAALAKQTAVPAHHASRLADVRAEQPVVTAQASLSNNLVGVRDLFQAR